MKCEDKLQSYIYRLSRYLSQNRDKYAIRSAFLFGSIIRGGHDSKSDLDLLIDFSKPISLFTLSDLQHEISQELGILVDITDSNSSNINFLNSIEPDLQEILLDE